MPLVLEVGLKPVEVCAFSAGDELTLNATVPAKPFRGLTVIAYVTSVELELELTVRLVGLALRVKSGGDVTISATVVVRVKPPLVPVIVRV